MMPQAKGFLAGWSQRLGAYTLPARAFLFGMTVVGVLGVGWLAMIRPTEQCLSDLRERREFAEQARQRLEGLHANRAREQAEDRLQQRFADELERRDVRHTTLFKRVSQIADEAGLDIVTTDAELSRDAGIRIALEGSFRGILLFLSRCAQGALPVLESFTLGVAEEMGPADSVRLELVLLSSGGAAGR